MSVTVDARVAGRDVALAATLPSGTITAVVGPNGAGKSTLVQLVVGLLRPTGGRVRIGDRDVTGLAPHRRSVALLDQRPLLFPHLDVLDNVAFGARARGLSRRAARERAMAELAEVEAASFAGRSPGALSGGQAQRVALARALATDPDVVLLDEPFAALDVGTAAVVRTLLARRLAGRTVILVTHDPLDVWALADELLCLEGGRVTAHGPVADLLDRPGTGFLADLSGVNLLHGQVDGEHLRAGEVIVTGQWDPTRPPRRDALATFDPAAVALFRGTPEGSPRNSWPVVVAEVIPRGPRIRVRLTLADGQTLAADLTAQGAAALGVAPGDPLVAQVKATQVTLYGRS